MVLGCTKSGSVFLLLSMFHTITHSTDTAPPIPKCRGEEHHFLLQLSTTDRSKNDPRKTIKDALEAHILKKEGGDNFKF